MARLESGPVAVEVRPVREEELEEALPLIAGYQRFYLAQPDHGRNRSFFRRFLEPSDEGLLLGAWFDGRLVGFSTIYWTHSSTRAADIALMNDLFVAEDARGSGAGRALIRASAEAAREAGMAALEWFTATDNDTAQRLYDSIPEVRRSAWFAYEIDLR
jgi:ribosomal protein S18 acetylase RimI-like enzyme